MLLKLPETRSLRVFLLGLRPSVCTHYQIGNSTQYSQNHRYVYIYIYIIYIYIIYI